MGRVPVAGLERRVRLRPSGDAAAVRQKVWWISLPVGHLSPQGM
ncbi:MULTISPECIES: hypothetical protein [unclassified Streptomyces]